MEGIYHNAKNFLIRGGEGADNKVNITSLVLDLVYNSINFKFQKDLSDKISLQFLSSPALELEEGSTKVPSYKKSPLLSRPY